jgi:hypothetical protein
MNRDPEELYSQFLRQSEKRIAKLRRQQQYWSRASLISLSLMALFYLFWTYTTPAAVIPRFCYLVAMVIFCISWLICKFRPF